MTRNRHENIESFQGSVTKSRARKIDLEEEFEAIEAIPTVYPTNAGRVLPTVPMEAIGRQEMAYSKLARARSNCYKDGGCGGNAYGGSHHRDRHSTHRSQMGISNFSSCAKAFDHIPYEDCCVNSPYDVHKRYHGSHEYRDQNCGDHCVKFKKQAWKSLKL
ncbi:hypothetical protein M9H77_31232 [Catharanthus roseus]|uniref:Uncharacterized protein n=1 Tax=Catharanthus roseus TaxID=4058 RepID=A0ACC0A0J9_CATRO|nr:hypothetical protein M9H77_31232 [Catharanthus roseus]